jgi:hypothetical protein
MTIEIDLETDKYLSLYPEDFISTSIWDEVCQFLDTSSEAKEVRIYFTKDTVKEA